MKNGYILPAALAFSSIIVFYTGPAKAAIALLLVAILNTYIVWQQTGYGRRMFEKSKLALRTSHLPTFSAPLQKRLTTLTLRTIGIAILLAALLLVSGIHGSVDSKTQLLMVVMLLVAVLPASLPLQLSVIMRWAPPKRAAALIGYAVRTTLTTATTVVLVVAASFIAKAGWHVPLALSVVQILLMQFVFELLLSGSLAWEGKAHTGHVSWENELGFSFIAAAATYGNYLFSFARSGLSPRYISTANPYYFHATAVALITLLLCHMVSLLLVRTNEGESPFSAHIWSSQRFLQALGISLFIFLAVSYIPLLHSFFDIRALSWTDWLWALVGSAIYLMARMLQRHTRKHSRRAVINLHRQLMNNKNS